MGGRAKSERWVERGELDPKCILVAEDDLEMRRWVADSLRRFGYAVVEAKNGSELADRLAEPLAELLEGRGRLPRATFDLVISDQRMPGPSGLEVLAALRDRGPVPPFLLITGFGGAEFAVEARRAGARAVLDKPFDMLELVLLVSELIGPARA